MSEVYFVQPYAGGPIKIGRSNDPEQRLRALQSGSPAPLDLLCVIPGGERVESAFHELFAEGRLHGEWFDEATPGLAHVIEDLIAPDLNNPEVAAVHAALYALRQDAEPTALPAKSARPAPPQGG